jgi:DNA-directed RNA polymerase subunit RPC12/RpoP
MRGRKKYRCDECKQDSLHHWIELNRAARLRCPGCGSARMALVTAEARAEAAGCQAVRVAGGTPCTTTPGPRPHRKVT